MTEAAKELKALQELVDAVAAKLKAQITYDTTKLEEMLWNVPEWMLREYMREV